MCLLQRLAVKRRGEGILRVEDARTSEEDDDIDSQDSNMPIDHGHLARNCLIKVITPAVKASVISKIIPLQQNNHSRTCIKNINSLHKLTAKMSY